MQPRKFLLAAAVVFGLGTAGLAGPAAATAAVQPDPAPVEVVEYAEDMADYVTRCYTAEQCCPEPPPQSPINTPPCQPE